MRRAIVLLLLCLCLPLPLLAAGGPSDLDAEKPYGALQWRLVGPAVGGRISRVAGVPGNPQVYYAAAAQGGVWKSENGGRDWKPIFDDQPTQSIGAIAVARSDPNVIYVGGGEGNPRGNVAIGLGIWKSIDAGATWQHVWKGRGQIGTLAVHPRHPDIAFAAVLGSPFGPGAERGVYRTTDGGATWKQVLKKDADTGASDVHLDPNNPNIVYAGMWQFRRSPWVTTSGGPGSGLWRSSDGGETWKQLTGSGLPEGEWGKVGIGIAPSDSNRVYALIEAKEGGLFRSDDAGGSWTRINAHRSLRPRAWYYTVLTVDPTNPDVLWVPQVPLLKSIDGGKSFTQVKGPHHGDHHDIWIDPKDPRRVISGNDGGVDISTDGGKTWFVPPLPLAQFYNIAVDDRVPWHVAGTIQDWGTAAGPSRSLANDANGLANWLYIGGGEAGDVVWDRARPGAIFAGEYGGYISYHVENGGWYRNVSAWPANPSGIKPSEYKVRFQWTAPIAPSPHDPDLVYHGANVLYASRDQGASWTAISGDLTRNDRNRQGWSGGPITGDITGVETYGTIFSIAESPVAAGTIWAGSDDGLVHVTRDGGKTWANVTPKTMSEWGTIEAIEPSRADAGTAYVVVHRYRLDDFKPYLFRTRDFGRTWDSLVRGIPDDLPLWVVREDPDDARVLYLGTDRGVMWSTDAGATWRDLRINLPAVTVTDLEAKHGDLVAGTRGRSIWALEGLATLRGLDAVRVQGAALLPVAPAYRFGADTRWDFLVPGAIPNPPIGAVISYWLKDAPKDPITLEITDASDAVVRTLSSVARTAKYGKDDPDEPEDEAKPALTTHAGLNRVAWDLRHEGARRIASKLDAGNPERGPLAVPGRYTATLKVGDRFASTAIDVRADPRSPAGAADFAANLAFALDLRAALDRTLSLVETLQAIRAQVGDLKSRAGGRTELVGAADAVLARAAAIEDALHNPEAEVVYDILAGRSGGAKLYSQLAPLYSWAQDSDHAPTRGMRERRDEVVAELERQERALAALRDGELDAFERALARAGLPRVIVPGT
ncbi:MAG: WD40/YVTN/BNR-like repeat-containing protein [Pseudomonadota bacterium]